MVLGHSHVLHRLKTFGFFLALLGSSFSNSFCGIGLGLYAGALALLAALDRPYDFRPFQAWQFLPPLLVSLAVSVWISAYPWISVQGYGKYLQGLLLFYAALDTIRSESRTRALIRVLAAAYLLASLSGVYQQIFGVDPVRGHAPNTYTGAVIRLTRRSVPFLASRRTKWRRNPVCLRLL